MKVVVLEHLTSLPAAPACGTPATAGLAAEGGAMRDAVVEDLVRLGGVEVTVLHRAGRPGACLRRLARRATRGRLRLVGVRGDRDSMFREEVRRADAALVIAPETDGVLLRLSRLVEDEGRLLLGPSSRAVALSGDKLESARRLRADGIPAPSTERIPLVAAPGLLARRPLPFVLKPREGCGGLGVALVRRRGAIAAALDAVRRATARDDLLVQENVEGAHASVSLIAAGIEAAGAGGGRGSARVLPLGLNRQDLGPGGSYAYRGGETPFDHPASGEALALAERAIAALARAAAGVRGYLGVDLVLAADGPRVIEINPRLTTSYVGLRRVLLENPAGLILDAALGRPLPERVEAAGRCRFRAGGRLIVDDSTGGSARWRPTSAGTSAASI